MRSETHTLSDTALVVRLLQLARPFWLHILGIFLAGLLATPLALLIPIPLKIVVDNVIGTGPIPRFVDTLVPSAITTSRMGLLTVAVVLQILIVLVRQVQGTAGHVWSTWTGEKLTLDFRSRLFRHIQRLSFAFHDKRGTSDSIYRIQYDSPAIQHILIYSFIPLLSSVITVVSMIAITAMFSWRLALVALTIVPLLFALTSGYKSKMRGRYVGVKELESQALSVVQEVLTALRVVKSFGREDSEQDRFVTRSREGLSARIGVSLAEGVFGLFVNIVTACGTAAVLFLGAKEVLSGSLTLGELLIVLSYLTQLYAPMQTISTKAAKMQDQLASAHRSIELLDELPEVLERPGAQSLSRAVGGVRFENVQFGYDSRLAVLRDLSFSIEPGKRIGIAGKTGAGKTTLASLITRFYDPQAGRILLDGTDIRDIKLDDFRNQFAIVLQEPVLFSTTIAENIAYAQADATKEQIIEAAKAAEAHGFISTLENGYDTQVGERGLSLSGGERQRISIARAFLKDAPILVLDEPTSSVDMETEAGIIEAMERLMSGRTTFMIAHRLTTLQHCDVLLVLDKGQVSLETSDVSSAVWRAIESGSIDADAFS